MLNQIHQLLHLYFFNFKDNIMEIDYFKIK